MEASRLSVSGLTGLLLRAPCELVGDTTGDEGDALLLRPRREGPSGADLGVFLIPPVGLRALFAACTAISKIQLRAARLMCMHALPIITARSPNCRAAEHGEVNRRQVISQHA